MKVSRDLIILRALTDHLEGITPAHGYPYDLRGSVFRGRTKFGDEESLPMLSILEAPRTEDPIDYVGDLRQQRTERWSILLQGWAMDDKKHPCDPAYLLKAVCEDRLSQLTAVVQGTGEPAFPAVFLLGRRVVNIQMGPGIVSPPREGISARAFFYLPLVLERAYKPTSALVETT